MKTSAEGELNVASVQGNVVSIQPYTSTFSEAGKGYLQIRVRSGGRELISFAIDVYIQEDKVVNPTSGSSSDVIKVLVNQYVDDATGTLFEDLKALAEVELNTIKEQGQSALDSIPVEYSELEQATYNAYPTESETGNPIYFDDGAKDIPVKELIVNLEPKQSGSGDPSPSNVRPITGYDGVVVKRTGKNLLKPTQRTSVYLGVTYSVDADGKVTVSGTATSDTSFTIYSSGDRSAPFTSNYTISLHGADKVTLAGDLQVVTYHFNQGQTIGNLSIKVENGVTYDESFNVQIELGSTATDYEPYTSQEYSITFPSSVGTVYGGTLNVTTGELTVDRAMVTLNGTNYPTGVTGSSSTDTVLVQTIVPNIALVNDRDDTKVISDYLKTSSDYDIYRSSSPAIAVHYAVSEQQRRLWLRLPNITSEADAKSYLASNPLTVVYPLATPTTYQLTPTEVSTLLGSNTIQSDGSMELDYRADTTKVIEKLTNAIISLGGNV